MPRLPVINHNKLEKVLKILGFEEIRQSGSHVFYKRKNDGKTTVVPRHNKDLGKGLLRRILREIDLPVRDLEKWLRKI
jgi:predicted RNA binding protein YcfA (HicA-like mRNA interferase family)